MKKEQLKLKRKNVSNQYGITLIALVITIIVLLILAGVTINLTLGDNGIFKTAEMAAKNYTDAQNKELAELNQFNENLGELTDFENQNEFNKKIKVNKPKLLSGMTPIKFTDPTDTAEGTVQTTNSDDINWYNYEQKKWANAKTADGSMWVWIPRYAYRINETTKTCEIIFLIGTSDKYYDENGNIQTAKRAKTKDEIIDTKTGFTVHPAFTDESSKELNYANGGWDKELTGIWVAKFEAGYAGGNNSATKGVTVNPELTYSQTSVYGGAAESPTGNDGTVTARNWTDGEYAEKNAEGKYVWKDNKATTIKYPTFQGITYSMNYINHNDAYNLARALTTKGNIYGLNAGSTDSHMMKNSEWGAISYLSQSKYGLNGTNIYINNVSLNNSTSSVYGVTGCSGKTADAGTVATTIEAINDRTANCYVWSQKEGTRSSSTGTIYGIYDLSGGLWERTAAYVANGNYRLKTYGASITHDGDTLKTTSTKYTTVYPHDTTADNTGITENDTNLNTASNANYKLNTKIYGDAIRETSTTGTGSSSWYSDYSNFPALYYPFSMRGGSWHNTSLAGLFSFDRTNGSSYYSRGFRPVLVAL